MTLRLYSPSECAEMLSLNKATISRMIRDRTLPAVLLRAGKRGNTYRVPATELDRFLSERSTVKCETAQISRARKRR